MLIKQVVIQGFKTFATKTEFVFDPGVTAVVGPNGSGKSNIVDAIRWCLGEQSFTLLRSKKTSDVIFSGSDRKARLSMAQVTLKLDNSAGEIPIDYTEVEITRRAYRDGNNEYLINGQRVRLIDVNELLAQTGLGRRTYALVGQGLIDKVLSLAPEERRSLFEEAAGITGYQTKRAATLRRLEATQQNLTRVHDIVAELSPRLKYLRRQADRARERAQIADDLRNLLRIWYGYRWHNTLGQLAEHHTAEQRLRLSVADRQKSLAALSEKIEGLRIQQVEVRSQLGELHRESSVLHRDAEVVGRELAVGQERQRQTGERLEEVRRELAPLRLQHDTLQARLNELTSSAAEAERLFLVARQESEEAQAEVDSRQQARTRLQQALEQAREELSKLSSREAEVRSRLDQLRERRNVLEIEQAGQRQARTAAEGEAAVALQEEQEAASQVASHETQIVEIQTALAALRQQVDNLRTQLTEADRERQALERSADRLLTRRDLLQRLRDEGAGYASGVRSVLQAARSSSGLEGLIGTVASQLHVPSHLDKAIETALGGAYQNVIARSWEDARTAIDFLKRDGHGRATFLPLDRLNVLPMIAAPKRAGILGNAVGLVAFDENVAEAIHLLLNRVWVAEDLPAARRALDEIRHGARPTVVTLDGEIVRPGGSVTGGSDRNRQDDSVLARERELRELPAQLASAEARTAGAVAQCRALSGQLETATVAVQRLQSELTEANRTGEQARLRLSDVRLRLDRAQQAVRWQGERLTQTAAELAGLDKTQSEFVATASELTHQRADVESALTRAEQAVEEAGLGDLLNRLTDLRTATASAEGDLRSQRDLLRNTEQNLTQTERQISAKEGRAAELAEQGAQLKQRLQLLEAREAELSAAIHALQKRIDPAEAERARLESEQAAEEERERVYQQTLRTDESAWNVAQLQHQRTEDALHQMRHEIEQDLGLVLLEESEELAYQPPLPWDSIVEQLLVPDELPEGLEKDVREMRARLSRVSNVNPDAPREYEDASERFQFLETESKDLEAAASDLRKILRELDEVMRVELARTFSAVAEQFVHFFQLLFNGGTAKLELTDPDDIANTGIEIIARPPGKRPQSLALLSGGERTLSACALIFAILRVSPTPFCVLDEVDAALDEANVDRFRQTVDELSDGTQFIIVTHNRRTLEGANAIYGVTMGGDGVSKVISLRLEADKLLQQGGEADADGLGRIEEVVQL